MTQPESTAIRPVAAFARLALASVLSIALLLGIGCLPTRHVAGSAGVTAMFAGALVALVAALTGLIPPILALRRAPRDFLNGVLLGMAVRFALTIGLTVAAALSGLLAPKPLAVWVVIGYLTLLAVDTLGVSWLAKRARRIGP